MHAEPSALPIWPAGHAVGAAVPPVHSAPAKQGTQAPYLRNLPAGQELGGLPATHAVWPALGICPDGQGMGAMPVPPGQMPVPTGQGAQ